MAEQITTQYSVAEMTGLNIAANRVYVNQSGSPVLTLLRCNGQHNSRKISAMDGDKYNKIL